MILDTHDIRSAAVLKLQAHVAQRLEEARALNDNPQDAEKTAALRGRILELKHIRDLLATGEG